jgi:uncharacterized protein (TIGR02145 family)
LAGSNNAFQGLVDEVAIWSSALTPEEIRWLSENSLHDPTQAEVSITGVTLNENTAILIPNETLNLTATVEPYNATNKAVTWESSNPAVATVVDGLVTAITFGEATITVTTVDGGKTTTCVVTVAVPDPGISLTVGSTLWASVSIDDYQTFAARPDMFTKYYQWNRATAWPATGTVSDWTTSGDASSVWTINPCPAGWRLPTRSEVNDLNSNVGRSYATAETRGNAVAGFFLGINHATCSLPDNMNGCIFLPAGGWRHETSGNLTSQGVIGRYWTTNVSASNNGMSINFNVAGAAANATGVDRGRGQPIRCVKSRE